MAEALADGVHLHPLTTHPDDRGALTEVFRNAWAPDIDVVQWNFVRSAPNVLRGVHLHLVHTDYLVVLAGEALVGLRDLRRGARTHGCSASVAMTGDAMTALVTPPSVAHGFHFHTTRLHTYAVTHHWDPEDELGCHWSDPALGIAWDVREPMLSERDASPPALAAQYERRVHP
jgi:dTDP-4-dehydrorhamnose 3,5-epimerase